MNYIIKNRMFFVIVVLGVLASCTKDMTKLNENPKVATTVQGEMLFSNAEKAFVDAMTTPNVNSGIFELITQYWAETTYPQESQYDLGNRNIPLNWWNTLYRDVIMDFDRSISLMREQASDPALLESDKIAYQNKIAIAKIFRAYAFSSVVNTFGDVPYTEALLGAENLTPVYDKQADVYNALLDTISTAIGEMDVSGESFGSADLVYGGDVSLWYKAANSILLKLAINIADVDQAKAKSLVEAAAKNVISGNEENATFAYTETPPNVNPIWTNLVQSGRNDFVIASTIIDTMLNHDDPRLPLYFTSVSNTYKGGTPGAGNSFSSFSHASAASLAPDFPAQVISYSEVALLLSEAAARNMNVGGTAEAWYDKGVTASIEQWGGSSADASDYLSDPANKFDETNWKKSIGVQAWIAYYTRGFDSWVAQRRLDYPQLEAPPSAISVYPVRYTYPATEPNLNKANYDAASSSIGGDEVGTKLFWDKF